MRDPPRHIAPGRHPLRRNQLRLIIESDDKALALARIFTHYCVNGAFLQPGQLLRDLSRIRHLPAEIVQGRYDIVTPMCTAWRLKTAWPEARFTIVTEANHAATPSAPALSHALRDATDRLRDSMPALAA